jgi:hypothetical protein
MTMRLYELSSAQQALLDEIADAEGELTPELEARLLALEAEAVPALENMGRYIRTLEAEADVFRQESQRCAARRGTLEKRAEWLKGLALDYMTQRGMDRVKGRTLSLRRDQGRLSCNVENANLIPERFRVVVPETFTVDKAAIIEAAKAGQDVPGAKVERKPFLVIR